MLTQSDHNSQRQLPHAAQAMLDTHSLIPVVKSSLATLSSQHHFSMSNQQSPKNARRTSMALKTTQYVALPTNALGDSKLLSSNTPLNAIATTTTTDRKFYSSRAGNTEDDV